MSTPPLVVKHTFTASAERVYDAWLDPAKAGKFLFTTPTGQMQRVEIEARVGGKFSFVDRRDGTDYDHHGTYLELVRPTRIVFEFAVMDSPFTRVAIDIVARGSGCEVTLTHDGVPEKMKDRSRGGWTKILENCAKQVEGVSK